MTREKPRGTRLTVARAKRLRLGDIICEYDAFNADGTPRRWRVSGQPKTWKTRPDEVRVPVKYGLRGTGYVDERNVGRFFSGGDCGR